jgi:hypothetical protein
MQPPSVKNFTLLHIRSIVIVTLEFGVPILCTQFRKLPFATGLLVQLNPFLVYPSAIRFYQVRPLPQLIDNEPTVEKAASIFFVFALNLILCAVNYGRSQPHPRGFKNKEGILFYVSYRTGHTKYALLPLVVLLSSRKSFLLWITNWCYGTYLLLDRWVARLFAKQAIVHNITLLMTYQGSISYAAEFIKPYWLWGIVATVLPCATLFLSVLYFRCIAYEVFLIIHIVLHFLVIVGCWYHVVLR